MGWDGMDGRDAQVGPGARCVCGRRQQRPRRHFPNSRIRTLKASPSWSHVGASRLQCPHPARSTAAEGPTSDLRAGGGGTGSGRRACSSTAQQQHAQQLQLCGTTQPPERPLYTHKARRTCGAAACAAGSQQERTAGAHRAPPSAAAIPPAVHRIRSLDEVDLQGHGKGPQGARGECSARNGPPKGGGGCGVRRRHCRGGGSRGTA